MNFFIIIFSSLHFLMASQLPNLSGKNILTLNFQTHEWHQVKKGTVVLFLSATCPCSDAHINYLKELKEEWSDFKFIGFHSNVDEDHTFSKNYFSKVNLNFNILMDEKLFFAGQFKAHRTPHAFVISPAGKIVYQGGVSNSSNPKKADKFYLKDALTSISENKKIQVKKTRVLGCPIDRE